MRETWYVLEDGSVADPALIVSDDHGRLSHEDGRKVAYGPHGPRSRGVDDPESERAKGAAPKRESPRLADREMKPEAGKGYKTR